MNTEHLFEDVQRDSSHFLKLVVKRSLLTCSYGNGMLPVAFVFKISNMYEKC